MDRRIISILLFIILVMASIPLVMNLLRGGENEEPAGRPVQSFTFEQGRQLHITGRQVHPLMRARIGLYYETHVSTPADDVASDADAPAPQARMDQPGAPNESESENENENKNEEDEPPGPAFFATLPPERDPPQFVAHVSRTGSVVGIAAESDPSALLILHDFETGESWPRRELIETSQDLTTRAQRLLNRLTADQGDDHELRLVVAEGLRPLEELIALPQQDAQDERPAPDEATAAHDR